MFEHPVVIYEFCDIVSDIIRTDKNTSRSCSKFVFFDIFNTGGKGGTRGSTTQETFFLDKSSSIVESVFITNFHPFINERSVEHSWNEIVADSFDVITTFWSWGVQRAWLGKD
jgi:hypothetical protein